VRRWAEIDLERVDAIARACKAMFDEVRPELAAASTD